MKIALYGMPCSGKTTLLKEISNIEVINGSSFLNKLQPNFNKLPENEKEIVRLKLIEYISKKDTFIIDGHYSFGNNVVFSEADATCYDVFLYLYEKPEILRERMFNSSKNKKYNNYDIEKWQINEIEGLRNSCHKNNKDFYVIDNHTFFYDFLNAILNGFSNVNFAKHVVSIILNKSKAFDNINLLDGDKTITIKDTSRLIYDYKTDIFDGNFYTGFQFWLQDKELQKLTPKIVDIEYNNFLLNNIKKENSYIISSGYEAVWSNISKKLEIPVFSGINISTETKYFITKFLKYHKKVTAYGDSANDYYMLKEADESFLVIQDNISSSLKEKNLKGIKIMYTPYIYSEKNETEELKEMISITKSDSGVNGNTLSKTHLKLGNLIGDVISKKYDPSETTIVTILRGGIFFATGIYFSFNCKFELFDPKKNNFDNLNIKTKNIILVDSVVNNGSTLEKIIEKEKTRYNIIIATNVIREDSLIKFVEYPLYAIRSSKNNFIGTSVKKQTGNKGPDTTERLFNKI